MASNGEVRKAEDMTVDQKLDVLIEALAELTETLKLQQEELVEKLANLTIDNDGYNSFD